MENGIKLSELRYTKVPYYSKLHKDIKVSKDYKGELYIIFDTNYNVYKTFIQLTDLNNLSTRPNDKAMQEAVGYKFLGDKFRRKYFFGEDLNTYYGKNGLPYSWKTTTEGKIKKPVKSPVVKFDTKKSSELNKALYSFSTIKNAVSFITGSNWSGAEEKPFAASVYSLVSDINPNINPDCYDFDNEVKLNLFNAIEKLRNKSKKDINTLNYINSIEISELQNINYIEPSFFWYDYRIIDTLLVYNQHAYEEILCNNNNGNMILINFINSKIYKDRSSKLKNINKEYLTYITKELIDEKSIDISKSTQRARSTFRKNLIEYTNEYNFKKNTNIKNYIESNKSDFEILEAAHIYDVSWIKEDIANNISDKNKVKELLSFISNPNNGVLTDPNWHEKLDKKHYSFKDTDGKVIDKNLNDKNAKLYIDLLHYPNNINMDRSKFIEMRNKRLNIKVN